MTTKKSNTKKPLVSNFIQLPCRARPHEAMLIRKGAELDTRDNLTTFIITAAMSAARASIAAHGLSEADVLAEAEAGAKKSA